MKTLNKCFIDLFGEESVSHVEMRKDSKYNRLTWQRKVSVNRKHPVYTKEVQREMYLGEEITVDDTWETDYTDFMYESEVIG